jgi:ribosome-associated toxin RatA of RatAB toxin-antitoxin module
MPQVDRTALVPYTPAQMFALVADIERYPDFVPWVTSAEILERTPTAIVARLEMERSGVREKFTTRNLLNAPHHMDLQLVDGPFKVLEGRWTFEEIAARGSRIGLSIRFEFANRLLAMLLNKSFEKSCGQLVDAFVARARSIHGSA